ncbi:MAG: hypothetical protein IJG18_09990 [Kiritimatiellae bacterium]|nr:hypothetical protein [Kiritimatiellia bacterium]
MNMQMKHFASAALVLFAALAAHSSDAVKVACIGDSITYGLGLADRAKESYPAQLQKLLDEFEPGKYEVRNFGNSGRGIYLDSMRGSEKRGFRYMPEHKAALEWKPDIVICNLGINDCGEYIKEYTGGRRRGQFIEDYLALLGDYSAQAKTNLAVGCRTSNVVCRVPKIFFWTKLSPLAEGQKFYRSPEPFLMQADLESVAKKMNAVGIDMQEPLREKMDEIFAHDKIHPNAEGARIIAETTFKAIQSHAKSAKVAKVSGDKELCELGELSARHNGCEIWLCAGQSNMQKGWNEFNAMPQEKERVKGEMARLAKCNIWLWDFNDGKWTKLSPDNALRKSAFGVSFAIRRAEATGKAVFMLYVAAGGAPTESFLSEQTMCAIGKDGKPLYPHLAAIATNRHRLDQNKDFPCAWVAREYPRRRNNMEEGHWWPVSLMYDRGFKHINKGIKHINKSEIKLDGILWYQGESNATTCVAPDTPTPREYQLETLRALVSELRGDKNIPFIMMGLPKMNRPWEQYRAVQKQVCDETGAIFVDTFAAGLGDPNDVHPRDKTAFADLAAKAASAGK